MILADAAGGCLEGLAFVTLLLLKCLSALFVGVTLLHVPIIWPAAAMLQDTPNFNCKIHTAATLALSLMLLALSPLSVKVLSSLSLQFKIGQTVRQRKRKKTITTAPKKSRHWPLSLASPLSLSSSSCGCLSTTAASCCLSKCEWLHTFILKMKPQFV